MSSNPLDLHGKAVNSFGMDVPNFGRIGELSRAIITMLDSADWRDYRHGGGEFHFMPAEFDYFLALHRVNADDLPRLAITPEERQRLAEAMDRSKNGRERRTIEAFDAAHPRAGLAKHWSEARWGAVKYPLGVRVVRQVQQLGGLTFEAHARLARMERLKAVKGWQSRVKSILTACEDLSRDELLAVVEALKAKARAMQTRRSGKERTAQSRRRSRTEV